MRATLKPRTSAADALRIVSEVAPTQPPVQVQASDRATTLNLRARASSVRALTEAARRRGLTLKQLVFLALRDAGVDVAAADLEDRTPRRKEV